MPKLKEEYNSRIIAELEKKLGTTNKMLVPRLQKVVLNMGFGIVSKDEQKALVDDLMAVVSKYPAGTTGTRVQAALAQVLDRRNGPSMTVTDIAFAIANANRGGERVRLAHVARWALWRHGGAPHADEGGDRVHE